ncbi:conserved hypothetical protein [Trichinella spiralis]|uniref:hypothetical protein n=1 Tax=Trichinella spiralis TaxID=6334 RepID=UPI0001EFCCFA|nr:conserved hypothetical protein [Trichinella spiralis]
MYTFKRSEFERQRCCMQIFSPLRFLFRDWCRFFFANLRSIIVIRRIDSLSSRRINKFGRIRFNESTKLLFTVDFSRPFRQFIHPSSSSFFSGICVYKYNATIRGCSFSVGSVKKENLLDGCFDVNQQHFECNMHSFAAESPLGDRV